MREWEHQLRQIIANSSAVIYVKDTTGCYQLINKAFEALFNCTADQVIGRDDRALFPSEIASRLGLNDKLVLARGQASEFEEALILNGREYVFISNKFPLFDADGTLCGVCGISTDITRRVRVESALRAAALGITAFDTEVFDSIARQMQRIFHADIAFVSRVTDLRATTLETLSLRHRDRELPPMRYQLPGTPCAFVFDGDFHLINGALQERFPQDAMSSEFGLVSYAGYPLFSSDRKPLGLIAVAHSAPLADADLIESLLQIFAVRAATELERLDAHTSYRAIFESCEDAIFVHDPDTGAIVDANPKASEAYGYSHSEFLKTDISVLSAGSPPYTQEDAIRWLAAARQQPQRFEWRRRNRAGELFWDEVVLRRAQIGGHDRILAITRDITQRKAAEDALRQSEQQYKAVFSTALDCIINMDSDWKILSVNSATERCFGYTQEQFRALTLRDLIASAGQGPDHPHPAQQELVGRRVEVTARRAGGESFPAELTITALEQSEQSFYIGYLRDVTEQRQAEIERNRLEQQLLQAQRLEALGQLSGGVAHDFNNLLTGILGYSGMAATRAQAHGDEKLSRQIVQIQRAGERGRDLVAQLLTFSRGGQGNPQPVNLDARLQSFLPLLQSLLPSSITLTLSAEAPLPPAWIDPLQIEQVVMNLCINSRDAMKEQGEMHIQLRQSHQEQTLCASCQANFSGVHLELAVTDSGSGIPEAIRTRIFEPFFTTKGTGQGSGMGLAMVHGIVHEYGGHIQVSDHHPHGTVFRIFLPVMPHTGESALPVHTSRSPETQLCGRVLLVDDDALAGDFMADQLMEWGLEVRHFANPVEAQAFWNSQPDQWDVLILDQVMPGKTGLQLAEEMLALHPGLPIILYSGYSEKLNPVTVRRYGIKALLQKPVDVHELHLLLKEILDQN